MEGWKILDERDVSDETDYVQDQELGPESSSSVNSGTIPGFVVSGMPVTSNTRFVVTFLDPAKNYLVGDRGKFDYQYIEALAERKNTGEIIQSSVVVFDSIEFSGGIGYRVIQSPQLSDAVALTIRLFNIEPPAGAKYYRIWYREAVK